MKKIVQFPGIGDERPEHSYVDLAQLSDEEAEALFATLPQRSYEADVHHRSEAGDTVAAKLRFYIDEENKLAIEVENDIYFILDEAKLLKWLTTGRA